MVRWLGMTILVGLALLLGGCGQSCSQDEPIPRVIDTTKNPYYLSWYTSDLELGRVVWDNRTTGEVGEAMISGPTLENFWPFGYYQALHVEMYIPLASGTNDIVVTRYEQGWSCGFYEEYLITYFPP